jgi:hypothetical protein
MQMPHRLAVFGIVLALCLPAWAAAQPWTELSAAQQEALSPLSAQWNNLPQTEQQHLLKMARKYPQLTPLQKQRLHKRLLYWSQLTPEQREGARQKYKAFNKVPLATREQVKRMVEQQEAEKARAASAVNAAPAGGNPP